MIFSGQFAISLHTTGRKTDKENEKNVMIFSGQFGISLNQRRRRAPSVFLPTAVSPMNLIAHFSILFLVSSSFFSSLFLILSYLSHEPDCTFLNSFLFSLLFSFFLSHEPDCTFLTFSSPRVSRQKAITNFWF